MGGGTTPTSGNAAGSMDTWSTYNQQIADQQRQNQIGAAITKGFDQFGSGIASGAKPGTAPAVPQVTTQPIQQGSSGGSVGQIPQAQPQGINLEAALQRLFFS